MTDQESPLMWHFARHDGRMDRNPRLTVIGGKTYRLRRGVQPELCRRGFHASLRALDALGYAPYDPEGLTVSQVRLGGVVIADTDKYVASERTHLWVADCTTALHEFACFAAEWIMDHLERKGYRIDPRSRAAVAAKRAWLRHEINGQQLAAAWAAAGDAAGAAAGTAAGAAAGDAAWAAAWTAAGDAARDAAGTAAWDALNAELTQRLEALELVGIAP